MKDFGLKDEKEFEGWLQEEKEYLRGLAKEPISETLEMEYYQKLVKLMASE
jgi:hypothetical protein